MVIIDEFLNFIFPNVCGFCGKINKDFLCKDCEEKIVNIEIRKDSKRNRQILLVENTYLNKDVDTEKIFEKKYSTKPGNTGLGLWEVRQILKKNNNLNLFTSKDERFFKQQLEMYNL